MCTAGLTHYTIDAILSQRSFRDNHQVGLNAPLPQVVTAVTSVPWLHIKLAMKTLQGALWDVDATGPHRQRGQRSDRSRSLLGTYFSLKTDKNHLQLGKCWFVGQWSRFGVRVREVVVRVSPQKWRELTCVCLCVSYVPSWSCYIFRLFLILWRCLLFDVQREVMHGNNCLFLPWYSSSLHFVGHRDVCGPDVILPALLTQHSPQDCATVHSNPHVHICLRFLSDVPVASL